MNGTLQYTIRPYDTIWMLAQIFNTTVDSIMELNPGIDPRNLFIGQVLTIRPGFQFYPSTPGTPRGTVTPGMRTPSGTGMPGMGTPGGTGMPGMGTTGGTGMPGMGTPGRTGMPGMGTTGGTGMPGMGTTGGTGMPGMGTPGRTGMPGMGTTGGTGMPGSTGMPGMGTPGGTGMPGMGTPGRTGMPGMGTTGGTGMPGMGTPGMGTPGRTGMPGMGTPGMGMPGMGTPSGAGAPGMGNSSSMNLMDDMYDMDGIDQDLEDLRDYFRLLWIQHVVWTRMAVMGIIHNLPETQLIIQRLLRNPVDFANVFTPFYGDEFAREFEDLLTEHLTIAAEIVTAAKAGDNNAVADANMRWHDNADQIAMLLGSINPYWSEDDWSAMLNEHLELLSNNVTQMLTEQYEESINGFDEMEMQALEMADMMAEGIVMQFSEI